MEDFVVRLARTDERDAVTACVNGAYAKYIPRIGREPAPMHADYKSLTAGGVVSVIADAMNIFSVVVGYPTSDHYFLENVAVNAAYQGHGFGRVLMAFVEQSARMDGFHEIRLYTNELMTENLAYYGKLGFEEVDRRVENGFRRVFMRKVLS